MEANDNPIVVQSLIGKKRLPFYLGCLKSLINFSEDCIELLLHSDGTVSVEDEEFIFSELDGTKITICNSSANTDRIIDCLVGKPNCQKFRQKSIWGIEFFDPIFMKTDDRISFYLDADILFTRPFSGLFDRSQVKNGAIFLQDTQWHAYSFRPWYLLGVDRKPELVKGITTGLVFWDKEAIDWDYLEWFLGAQHLHHIPEWIMPTAQAGLANRCEAKTVCNHQITNLYPNAEISEDSFGVHLLGSYRKDWVKKLDATEKTTSKPKHSTKALFKQCEKLNMINYSLNQVKRWKNTRLNLW